jgi:hypothetical protein
LIPASLSEIKFTVKWRFYSFIIARGRVTVNTLFDSKHSGESKPLSFLTIPAKPAPFENRVAGFQAVEVFNLFFPAQ